MKVGEIVERDGSKYLITKVYDLCGSIAYDSVLAPEDKKTRGTSKKPTDTSDSTPEVDPGTDETPVE